MVSSVESSVVELQLFFVWMSKINRQLNFSFLGSEKYPGENEYKRYLSAHGVRSNASTSMHLTNYKFEVLADHAEKAVDIFSNFFVAPLFTSSGTGREVQAVDSENRYAQCFRNQKQRSSSCISF